MLTYTLGGIGLFLIGMVLMTDGLKIAAGDALKRTLERFTGGPLSAVAAGAGVTALVQSSSATTLMTIGFVSAGLLAFPQALGVILGANIGTTSTGWLVSLFGLKMSVLPAALPLVGIGALLRILTRGKLSAFGLAIAGFGLIFVGISTLQMGMSELAGRFALANLPMGGLGGRILLLLAGLVMTVVMQSSSAAVATTLAALGTGTINLAQAATLVVGQNIGTTVTAGLAAVGAAAPARRTALAHVLFNVFAGAIGFALIPLFIVAMQHLVDDPAGADGAVSLAAFHTTMNVLAVALVLPHVRRFSRLVERLLPDTGPQLTRHLDESVTRLAPVAIEAAHRTLREVLGGVAGVVLTPPSATSGADGQAKREALAAVRRFLARVRAEAESDETHARHVSVLHSVDHLEQLVAADSAFDARRTATTDPALEGLRTDLQRIVSLALAWADEPAGIPGEESRLLATELTRAVAVNRERILLAAASGKLDPDMALGQLDALRWIESVAHHLHRALHHLGGSNAALVETNY